MNNNVTSYNGELFLDILYHNLYNELADSYKRGQKNKEGSIREYLELIEKMHDKARDSERKKNLVKELYYDKYVIKKENLPESLSEKAKEEKIEAQKRRLDSWIDYLTDEKTIYPMWAKYWIFREMLKIGNYDEISGKYTKRTKETVKPFIEVNPEIIAKCIENVMELLGDKKQSGQQIRKKVSNVSFERMYIEYEKKYRERIKTNDGRWVKYNYGNKEDAKILAKSLEGYNTGWCTANENTAIYQVCGDGGYSGGDFYVYYTLDENNEYKIPRIAIRLDGHNKIGEIRGVGENQDLEEAMLNTLELKLKEMAFLNQRDVEVNLSIVKNLKNLVLIKNKTVSNIPLTVQEIMDLYTKRYGFGYGQDALVKKIISKRSVANDYKIIKNLTMGEKIRWIRTGFESWNEDEKEFIDEKELALVVVSRSWRGIKYVNPNVENYLELAKEIVSQYSRALQFVNSKANGYRELALETVKGNGITLQYVDSKADCYKEIAMEAVRQNGMAIGFVDSKVEGYKEIALEAVREYPNAIQAVNWEFEEYKEIAMEAVKQDGMALKYISPKVEYYKELAQEAVHQCNSALKYVNDLDLKYELMNQESKKRR